jgi:carbamoylphosphate synthase large subunit
MHLWINQGFSSQRDLGLLIKRASPEIVLTLTHKDDRQEILGQSDTVMPAEPQNSKAFIYFEYVHEVLDAAKKLGEPVTAMLAMRQRFRMVEKADELQCQGIRLAAGSKTKALLDLCEDKWLFTNAMQQAGIPIPLTRLATTAEEAALATAFIREEGHGVCVKPSVGVYGAGFWILDDDAQPFDLFASRETLSVRTSTYLEAFNQRAEKEPHLVMELLPGQETSVDAVCEDGKIVSHACRTKFNGYQHITTGGQEFEIAERVADVCRLDGLVNIQFKQAADGSPKLLEVNTRASGGVGYSSVAGINLPNDLKKMLHGEKIMQTHLKEAVIVKPINDYIKLG